MKNLQQQEWRSQLANDKNGLIIDVRTNDECNSGIIENAIMIDFLQPELFLQEIKNLDTSKNYYIYCRSGNRSGKACEIMDNLGFNETFNLIGGMIEWDSKTVSPN